jgi:hypothetical protein
MTESSPMSTQEIVDRFQWRLANQGLTMAIGLARLAPHEEMPLEALMSTADEALLEEKKNLRSPGGVVSHRERRRTSKIVWLH